LQAGFVVLVGPGPFQPRGPTAAARRTIFFVAAVLVALSAVSGNGGA